MSEAAGKINNYVCRECSGRIVTVNRDDGTTPFRLLCRVRYGCMGLMQSTFYRCDQSEPPTHEWFKPSLKWARRKGPDMLQHVKMGGLALRDVVADPEPAP
jgi:hypothetical protein